MSEKQKLTPEEKVTVVRRYLNPEAGALLRHAVHQQKVPHPDG